ncbi:MAG: CHAT domain-containing protein, partial [Roseiflexus sp.]
MAAQQPSPTMTPLRMLALIAAPLVRKEGDNLLPITPLPVYGELKALADICRRQNVALTMQTAIATTAQIGNLFATAAQPFDILHFIGHGSWDGQSGTLVLEDEVGVARSIDAAELQRLIGHAPCRLAFLNACHSAGLAEVLLNAGVPHVVAINAAEPVLDRAACAFAERFYAALLAGSPLAEAFAAGRAAVATDDELRRLLDPQTLQPYNLNEEIKFLLLPDGDPIHEQPLVAAPPRGKPQIELWRWDRTNLSPVSADPFVGRSRELHDIARALRDNRCVAVHGMGGMGKTALAEAAARWQRERDRRIDGVWFIGLRPVQAANDARTRIALELGLDPKNAESDQALARALGDRDCLLVLDDLDNLLTHDRSGLIGLLKALLGTRNLRLLTTARRDLPPAIHHYRIELSRLATGDAERAFLAFAPPTEEWGSWSIAEWQELQRFLDGYPFPIRLAASAMSAARIGLRDLLGRLRANPQGTLRYPDDAEDRTTSLAATLDVSYTVLPEDAQRAFALLALFPAGMTRDAARHILEIADETLETLVRHSMAEWRGADDYHQCTLPEPTRHYAAARLPAPVTQVWEAYAPKALDFYSNLIDAMNEIITGERTAVVVLTLEQPNIERVLEWGYAHEQRADRISLAARATAALSLFWGLTGEKGRPETLQRLRQALTAA